MIKMTKNLLILILLAIMINSLELRNNVHEMSTTHYFAQTGFTFNFTTIIIIAIIAVVAYFLIKCFCCTNT